MIYFIHEESSGRVKIGFTNRSPIGEFCPECGVNVRGSGVWVSRAKVFDPDSLPMWRPPLPKKTTSPLFDGLD